MNENKARRIAIRILDEFEELLEEKDIKIPSLDREGRSEEACLYGSEYYSLEDAITAILQETCNTGGKNQDARPRKARASSAKPTDRVRNPNHEL
jgi:hypothetical protein